MNRKTTWAVWGVMAATVGAIAVAFVMKERQARLVRGLILPPQLTIPGFTLTNQLGQAVTLRDLRGQVWIANIIFTRCMGPCPRLTEQTAELQAALASEKSVKLVTLTTDPDFDTPAVLKKRGEHFKTDPARWWFLTGSKKQIADLAIDGLKLISVEKEPGKRETPADLFIHSLLFVVVDKQGRLRAAVESTEDGWKQKVLGVTRYLLNER